MLLYLKPTAKQIEYLTKLCIFSKQDKQFGHSHQYEPTEQNEILSKFKQKSLKFEHNGLF